MARKHKKHNTHSRSKKGDESKKKILLVVSYIFLGLIIFWLAVGFYLFFKVPASIYIYPENPKQGDTVFIRVESKADSVWGNFDSENIIFYKKGFLNEWIAFLGVDAVHESGDYEISV